MDITLSRGKVLTFISSEKGLLCRIIQDDRGITLGPVETNELVSCLENIFDLAELSWKNLPAQEATERIYLYHLGYGSYAAVSNFRGNKYCDIRRYWLPPTADEPLPSKIGVVLNSDEVNMINGLRSDILLLFERPVESCWCRLDEPCRRCRPFLRRQFATVPSRPYHNRHAAVSRMPFHYESDLEPPPTYSNHTYGW